MDDAAWERVLGVCLTGAFNCRARARNPWFWPLGRSSTSPPWWRARADAASQLRAAKAGLEGLTRALAIELAPRGILVNAWRRVIETEMSRRLLEQHRDRVLSPSCCAGQERPPKSRALSAIWLPTRPRTSRARSSRWMGGMA